jgi:hypothetical protein
VSKKGGGYGPPTAYSGGDVAALTSALVAARKRKPGGIPTTMIVTGRIEWNGQERGHDRRVKLDDLSTSAMRRVLEAVDKAQAAQEKAAAAAPARTYTAKSTSAQARQLAKTRAGREALYGIAKPRTVSKWLAGTQQQTKANRERVAQAYRAQATRHVLATRSAAEAAQQEVAASVTAALAERYDDAEIRLRDITDLKFQ